ncbi:MAG: spore coat protein CotJB [Eubacterium sp.]|nr:spore coat protein CotJB [Eubacterium sp.]
MSKDKLLRRLSSLGFSMQEYRLFLDTHPQNSEAQELFDNTKKKYDAVLEEYEKQFGPLTLNGLNSDDWLKNPWPWDNDAN